MIDATGNKDINFKVNSMVLSSFSLVLFLKGFFITLTAPKINLVGLI